MKPIGENQALVRLQGLKSDFRSHITERFEHRAKSCVTCETQGACCLDAHFVNVHISRLEAVAIDNALRELDEQQQVSVRRRINDAIETYGLAAGEDSYSQTYACPLFEKGTGCLVHETAKPLPCITHACYESAADLPPDELLAGQEKQVDKLNEQTYGDRLTWLPLPVAIKSLP